MLMLVLLIFVAIIVLLIQQSNQAKQNAVLVSHTQEVLFQSSKVLATITDNETASRGYILSGNKNFLEPEMQSETTIKEELEQLKLLTLDNAAQQQRIDSLRIYVQERLAFADSTIALMNKSGMLAASKLVASGYGKENMDAVRKLIADIQEDESSLLEQRRQNAAHTTTWMNRILVAVIAVSFIVLLIFLRKEQFYLTEQKQAQAAIRKRDEYFRLLLKSVKDYAIIILDTDGIITDSNSSISSLKGYTDSELKGKHYEIFFTPEDREKGLPALNMQMAVQKGNYETEGWRVKKDGSLFWADVLYAALHDDSEKLYGYVKITRDVTARKKELEQMELLYRQVDRANDAIYTLDAETLTIKSWNFGAVKMYGYTSEEAIGEDPNELLKTVITPEEKQEALDLITSKDYWSGEIKRFTRQGEPIYVLSSSSTIRNNEGIITNYVSVSVDITEQKKLTEQLSHLAKMVEISSDAIVSMNTNLRIISWNKGAKELFGYEAAEVMGHTGIELGLSQYSEAEVDSVLQDLIKAGSWYAEMELVHKNGMRFFGSVSGNCIKNNEGTITSFFFIVKDITIRKQLEGQLRKYNEELEQKVQERTEEIKNNEIRYQYLFDNNPLPMWVVDVDTYRFLDVNTMASVKYGYSKEEFLTLTTIDIRPEEEKEKYLKDIRIITDNIKQHYRGVWKHMKKDGSIIYVEIFAHRIQWKGKMANLILSNDITLRKLAEDKLIASEEQYRNTLDHMLEGAQIIGFDWRYKYINDAASQQGKSNKEDLLGYTMMEKYPGIENTELFSIFRKCMKEKISRHIENEFKFPDGSSGWFELSIQPVPEGIFILSMDVTERKLAEESIIKMNAQLEERVLKRTEELKKANEELEAFSYSVSHDLRAPLRAIIGFSTILEEDYGKELDGDAQRIINVIRNNTAKMGHLIDDLLTFSRMGRHEINRTTVNTGNLVKEVIEEMAMKDKDKVHWQIHELPVVKADNSTMKQVWVNLISNAVKYSGKQEAPLVEIGAQKNNGHTVFFVKDNGVGFDEKYKNKLFRVFQRLHGADEFEGTGIGLAIVEKIISKHGGKVWAEAVVNKGASFYFSLPENEIYDKN
ncbi:MAG: PAS domain S-box protein [Bacteroidetes bacterium]|nr:PAS domain S-box protein [Bacteroidota bacterium]